MVMLTIILTVVDIFNFLCSLFEILNFGGQFAAELRDATYDLAEFIDKRWIFGLDSTTNE